MAMTPFEVRRWLPTVSLEPLELILAGYCARGDGITVVQVGACDGSNNDPIHRYVAQGLVNAVLIEPNPYAFSRLEKAYAGLPNVTLIQCAIGELDGEAELYRIKKTDKSDSEVDLTLQIASFSRKHLVHHGKKSREIEQIKVPCRTLSSLIAELGLSRIHLLQIDAEGFDAAVVRMALKLPVLPDCINFEHIHLATRDRRPLFDLLKTNGYLLGYDEWNILAMQQAVMERTTQVGPGKP
jgi:FkbM family methyltransferase